MYILGIMGGTRISYQDTSAALLEDGRILTFVEEERLSRVKHAPGTLPERSIKYILDHHKLSLDDIDWVCAHGSSWSQDFASILNEFFSSKFGGRPKNIDVMNHHDMHAASAYYASGFDETMIFTTDYSGDGISAQLAVGRNGNIDYKRRIERPNSLGIFYSILTEYCGFARDNDEYKVMGLSAYGDKNKIDFSFMLDVNDKDGYKLKPEYVKGHVPGEAGPVHQLPAYSRKLIEKLGPPRIPGAPMTDFYADIAASGQRLLEEAAVRLITNFHKETGLRKLCLAGGVALNVVMNQKLMELDFIDEIFVQPCSSDAGTALGGAYIIANREGFDIEPLPHVYYGPEFSNDEIEEALKQTGAPYTKVDDPASLAAEKVAEDKIVGWFQRRMEFGPRALGNRSILANPTNPDMKDIVNIKVKFREEFRPFCPSVIESESPDYFIGKQKVAPYMTITYDVKEGFDKKLPSITHVDKTARIQTVDEKQNPLFYSYLNELKKRIGYGVTMNTSFNVKGDPIVNTPYNALATLYGSGMDILIIGNYAVCK